MSLLPCRQLMPEKEAFQADDRPITAQQWVKGRTVMGLVCAMQEHGRWQKRVHRPFSAFVFYCSTEQLN